MIDGLTRLTDRFGESVVLVVGAPSAVVVHLDQMSQCAPGAEKLLFGVVALGFGCQDLCHGP